MPSGTVSNSREVIMGPASGFMPSGTVSNSREVIMGPASGFMPSGTVSNSREVIMGPASTNSPEFMEVLRSRAWFGLSCARHSIDLIAGMSVSKYPLGHMFLSPAHKRQAGIYEQSKQVERCTESSQVLYVLSKGGIESNRETKPTGSPEGLERDQLDAVFSSLYQGILSLFSIASLLSSKIRDVEAAESEAAAAAAKILATDNAASSKPTL
ncbi:hypothetical protein N7490_001591 [Penicillium lividum]|nr:hypothetical protein N7490_001591 [Penicillium lividum]